MPAFTWASVSASTLADVDPAKDPAVNPLTGDSPWRGSNGQSALIEAWGSAVWDDVNQDLFVPIGGGHGNYGGNEPYKLDLGSPSPAWRRLRAPSGAIGNELVLDDLKDRSGVYADGRPRAVHVYNNVAFATGVGPVIVRLASTFPRSEAVHKVFAVHPTTGESTLVFDFADAASVGFPRGFPGGTSEGSSINGAACYDMRRNRICSVGTGNNTYLMYCTPKSTGGMWSGGSLPTPVYLSGGPQSLIYLPDHDRYFSLSISAGKLLGQIVNPTSGIANRIEISGSIPSGLDLATMPGTSWAPELGRVLVWNNVSETRDVYMLSPIGDGLSQWVWGALPKAAGGSASPPARAGNGTFGLFGYSSSLRGCYLITSSEAPVRFFATQ